MIEVKTYHKETLAHGVDLALSNRLFVPGWDLNGSLKNAKQRNEGTVALVFKHGKPVAISFADRWITQAFTRKTERRNGYGRMAVKALREIHKTSSHGCGKKGSDVFWEKVWN